MKITWSCRKPKGIKGLKPPLPTTVEPYKPPRRVRRRVSQGKA